VNTLLILIFLLSSFFFNLLTYVLLFCLPLFQSNFFPPNCGGGGTFTMKIPYWFTGVCEGIKETADIVSLLEEGLIGGVIAQQVEQKPQTVLRHNPAVCPA
jgi:hypothetical protein